MRVLFLPVLAAVCALPFAFVTGCGGHSSDCTDRLTENGEDNSVYAGTYTATFTPDSGSARNTFTVNLKVLDTGFVQGTVSDPGSTSGTVNLSGDSIIAKGRCDGGKTYFRFKFLRSVASGPNFPQEELDIRTDTLNTLSGASVAGRLTTTNDANTEKAEVDGTLTISASNGD